MPNGSSTLYERLGGERAIEGLIQDFYRRVLLDPLLEPFSRIASGPGASTSAICSPRTSSAMWRTSPMPSRLAA